MTDRSKKPPSERLSYLRERHQLHRLVVQDAVAELDGYLQIVEEMLETAEKDEFAKLEEAWRSLPRHLPESARTEYWHNNLPYYWQQMFVPQFRFSFVLWSLSVIEFHLDWICRTCQEAAELGITWKDIHASSTLERAQKFLVGLLHFSAPSDDTWEKLKSLYKIRNTVAHSVGLVFNEQTRHQLAPHLKKFPGIKLNDDDELRIKKEFCQEVVAAVSGFLQELLDQQALLLEGSL